VPNSVRREDPWLIFDKNRAYVEQRGASFVNSNMGDAPTRPSTSRKELRPLKEDLSLAVKGGDEAARAALTNPRDAVLARQAQVLAKS
jgi:hypothetical protein